MIDVAAVIALLEQLARSGPDHMRAVVQMLRAAQDGREMSIDTRNLGVDPALISHLLEAAGQSSGGDGLMGRAPARRNALVPPGW
jgi:hypothetical protein